MVNTAPPGLWPHPSTLHLVTAANGAPRTGAQGDTVSGIKERTCEPRAPGPRGSWPAAFRQTGRREEQPPGQMMPCPAHK